MDKMLYILSKEAMSKKRKKWTAKEKFQVVIELLKWRKTQAQITSEYGVHTSQQSAWKEQFLNQWISVFESKKGDNEKEHKQEVEKLHNIIGQYAVEVDWLQKKNNET